MTDDEKLAEVTNLAERRAEQAKSIYDSPGETELTALVNVAMRGGFWGWVGTVLAGAAFGTPFFPLVGTIVGGVIAALFGFVPMLFATSLFVTLRGRLRIPAAMAWAGAVSGIVSCGSFEWRDMYSLPLPPIVSDDGALFIASVASVVGAIGARWMASRSIRWFELTEGRGIRSWRQFGIIDLLLLTTWLAVAIAVIQGVWPVPDGRWRDAALWLAVSIAAVLAVEWFVSTLRRRNNGKETSSPHRRGPREEPLRSGAPPARG